MTLLLIFSAATHTLRLLGLAFGPVHWTVADLCILRRFLSLSDFRRKFQSNKPRIIYVTRQFNVLISPHHDNINMPCTLFNSSLQGGARGHSDRFSRFDEIKKEEEREREKREALLYTAYVHVHLVSVYK